jgi:uncharacterized RDD family membrane protein YckC
MESPGPGRPSRETGLPPGVEVGPLGPRFVAYLIDALVPGIVAGVLVAVLPGASGTVRGVLSIVGALVTVAWAILVVYLQAEKAAGPGMRLMKLQLVGFYDGRPIGWGRVLIRLLILWLLMATGIGLVVLLITMVTHPRRQGWHDRAAKAVVIKERVLAPSPDRQAVAQPQVSGPPRMAPEPTYGPATRYSPVPGDQPAPGRAPAPLTPPTGTGYPPTGYPGVGYPPGADPYPPRAYPPGVPDPYPPVQPNPAPNLAPTPPAVAPTPPAVGPTAPAVVPAASPDQGFQPSPPVVARPPSAPPVAQFPPPARWVAVLDDGRRLIVDRLVLLGRNPRPEPGEEDAQLVKIADETRTVSKLHLAIGIDQAGLYVVDRGSTNGSTVTNPGGASHRCRPGDVVHVSDGSIVSMGDHWLEIRRGP